MPPADGPPPIHGPFCEFSCRLMSQRTTPPRLSGQEAGDMRDLVAWMLRDKLPARLNLQIHKYVWPPEQRGV